MDCCCFHCQACMEMDICIKKSLRDELSKMWTFLSQMTGCFYMYLIYQAQQKYLIRHMESLTHLLQPVNAFIRGNDFFHYHGLVLSTCWIILSVVAILLRKASVQIHAILFFLIDAATAFFIIGAMIRVYPYISIKWDQWSLLKKGHFIGGGVFLVLLFLQHLGGVTTLLKGIKYNPQHRMFGFYVANMGRIISVVGSIIGGAEQWVIYVSGGLTVLLLIGSTYKVFFASKKPDRANLTDSRKGPASSASSAASSPKSKSPKRD